MVIAGALAAHGRKLSGLSLEREGEALVVRLRRKGTLAATVLALAVLAVFAAAVSGLLGRSAAEISGVAALATLTCAVAAIVRWLPLTVRLETDSIKLRKAFPLPRTISLDARMARRAEARHRSGDRWSCVIRMRLARDVVVSRWLDEEEAKDVAFTINKYLRAAKGDQATTSSAG